MVALFPSEGSGDLRPPDDAGCANWPMGACEAEALELLGSEPHGETPDPTASRESWCAAIDDRGSTAALFLLDDGGLPVCCVNLAFSVAIAAAASGNMALIVEESRTE